jgi:hypothetical protein
LPKGGAFSCVLSGAQAREAVAGALVAVEPVAAALEGDEGYPVGPEGFGASALRKAVAALTSA